MKKRFKNARDTSYEKTHETLGFFQFSRLLEKKSKILEKAL